MHETELYPPVKAFLEAAGYDVKAEIGPADVMAVKPGEEPVIVELKIAFSLALFHQGVARLAVSDSVYLAVPRGQGRRFAQALAEKHAARAQARPWPFDRAVLRWAGRGPVRPRPLQPP